MYKQPLSLPKGERVLQGLKLWFAVGRKLLQWDVRWSWMPGLHWAKLFTEQHVTEDLPQIPCLVAPSLIRPAGQHRASPTSICSPGWGHSCGWHPGAQSLASLLPSLQALRVELWALVYSVSPRKHLPATGKSSCRQHYYYRGMAGRSGSQLLQQREWDSGALPVIRNKTETKRAAYLWKGSKKMSTSLWLVSWPHSPLLAVCCWVRTGSLGHWAARTRPSLHPRSLQECRVWRQLKPQAA